ncbi:MAG: zf-HC2 domain-containing protein [Acidobacteriota bacterium]|nr:zf-HC2 domain-containing protein [Acidobacteriota bacterium]
MPIVILEKICSQESDIAAYIDGELSLPEEMELEAHLTVCGECRMELNEQKKLLRVLDFALENEREFALPENFTRIVVANAESKVSGLRRPQERSNALLVCAALFLLVILISGREIGAMLITFTDFAGHFATVIGFVVHLFYDIALGAAIILRSISSQLIYHSAFSTALIISFFTLSLLALLRFIVRAPKLKIQIQEK